MSQTSLDHLFFEPLTCCDVPSAPPADVLAEVDAAFERSAGLFADELELHFTEDRRTGRVRGELCVPGGGRWARLSASEALAIACGDVLITAA